MRISSVCLALLAAEAFGTVHAGTGGGDNKPPHGSGKVVMAGEAVSLPALGFEHLALNLAELRYDPGAGLRVSHLGASGLDGVSIDLGDGNGWKGDLAVEGPVSEISGVTWEVRGTLEGVAGQAVLMGGVRFLGNRVEGFADSSSLGLDAHLVELFQEDRLIGNAVVSGNNTGTFGFESINGIPDLELTCHGPVLGRPEWAFEIRVAESNTIGGIRIINPGGTFQGGGNRVRVSPWPKLNLPLVQPPSRLLLTGMNLGGLLLSDEALRHLPKPGVEGLSHRALGQALFVSTGDRLVLSNIGSSGQDGVSVEVGGRSSGIVLLADPLDLNPIGVSLRLNATGEFDLKPGTPLGEASLETVRGGVLVRADFGSVGSDHVRVEVFRGSQMVGSTVVPGGLVGMLEPAVDVLPSVEAVGVVPPDTLHVFEGIAQSDREPLPCLFVALDAEAVYASETGERFLGDRLRVVTALDQPRIQTVDTFDVRVAKTAGAPVFGITREKLRIAAPELTRIYPRAGRAGELVEILGLGFGDRPENLGVMATVRVGSSQEISVPFEVLSASDTRLLARVGPVPSDALPGPLEVMRGYGHRAVLESYPSNLVRAWQQNSQAGSSVETFRPVPEPPTTEAVWLFSGPPTDGLLSLTLDLDWPGEAEVGLEARIFDDSRTGMGYLLQIPSVRFTRVPDPREAASRLGDLLAMELEREAGIATEVIVEEVSAGVFAIQMSSRDGFIDRGMVAVCVRSAPSPPVISDILPTRAAPGDLVTITGSGFGDDAKDVLVALQDTESSLRVPMEVVQADDGVVVARMGSMPPDVTEARVWVARGRGSRIRLDPEGASPELAEAVRVKEFTTLHDQSAATLNVILHAGLQCFHSDITYDQLPDDAFLPVPEVILPLEWPSNSIAVVQLVLHVVGTSYHLKSTVYLPDGGTAEECAQLVGGAAQAAIAQASGQGSYTSVTTVPEGVKLQVFTYNTWLSAVGSLSICLFPAPATVVDLVQNSEKILTVRGQGFGEDPANLNAAFVDGGSTRLFPWETLSAADHRLTLRPGQVSPDAGPGPLAIRRGFGSRGRLRPLFADLQILDQIQLWEGQALPALSAEAVDPSELAPAPGHTCYFSDPPVDGVLDLTFTNDWPPITTVSITAQIQSSLLHPNSVSLSAPAIVLPTGGTIEACADRMADVIRCAFWQQAALAVDSTVEVLPNGDVKLSVSLPEGDIDQGSLTVCAIEQRPAPVIMAVTPDRGVEGDLIQIDGMGFGEDPDNIDLTIGLAGGMGLVPFRVLSATDSQLIARVGVVPPGLWRGPIRASLGQGNSTGFEPVFPDTVLREPSWVWQGPTPADDGSIFDPRPTPQPSYAAWFHSGPPSNGVLRAVLSGVWLSNSLVSVTFRAHEARSGAGSLALDAPATLLPGAGTLMDCAERVANIIRGAFEQQAGVEVGATVDALPGAAAVALTIHIPGAFIDRGLLAIGVFDPVAVTVVDPLEAGAGDRVIITGSGFGTDRDALMVSVDHGETHTPLEVISAMEKLIVARVVSVGPDAQPGPMMVAQALGRRFVPDIPDLLFPNGALNVIQRGHIVSGPVFDARWHLGISGDVCYDSTGGSGELEELIVTGDFPDNAVVTIQYFFGVPPSLPPLQGIATFTVPGGPGSALPTAQKICDFLNQLGPYVSCTLDAGPPIKLTFDWITLSGPMGAFYPANGWVKVCYRYPTLINSSTPPDPEVGDLLFISGSGFGSDPDHLKVHVEGANGVLTLLPVISASETQLVARVNLVRPDAGIGPLVVTRGVGGRSFPRVPGITHQTGLWSWMPTGELPVRGSVVTGVRPAPADACFESAAADGLITLEVEGAWSGPTWVSIDFGIDKLVGGDPLAANVGATSFYLAGGSPAAGAEAIRQMLDGMVLSGIGFTHVTATQTGPDRYTFILSAEDFLGNSVPITGYVSLCYRICVRYAGTLHVPKGAAQVLHQATTNALEILNLGTGGKDGVVVELGAAQGWGAEFVPLALEDGQRFVTTLVGERDGAFGLPLVSAIIESQEGQTYISSAWKYVPVRRFLVYLEGSLGQGLEWGVFENNERIAVEAMFPDSCRGLPTMIRSQWLHRNEVWVQLAKPDCVCPGTNLCAELLVRIVPVDLPATDTGIASSVELTMTSGAAAVPASFTILAEYLKTLGHFHQALGLASFESGAQSLTLANLGSGGQDGVFFDLNPLPEFFGPPTLKGYKVALEPLPLLSGGIVIISATGKVDGMTDSYLGQAGLRHQGDRPELYAEFASVSGLSRTVEVLEYGHPFDPAQQDGGDLVAYLSALDLGPPRLRAVGMMPRPPFSFFMTFTDRIQFDLPDGSSLIGNEIRVMPSVTNVFLEGLSGLALLAGEVGPFTIQEETILPANLLVMIQDGTVVVSWKGDGFLEQASDPAGPWQDVQPSPASSPYVETAAARSKFFRLRQ